MRRGILRVLGGARLTGDLDAIDLSGSSGAAVHDLDHHVAHLVGHLGAGGDRELAR